MLWGLVQGLGKELKSLGNTHDEEVGALREELEGGTRALETQVAVLRLEGAERAGGLEVLKAKLAAQQTQKLLVGTRGTWTLSREWKGSSRNGERC